MKSSNMPYGQPGYGTSEVAVVVVMAVMSFIFRDRPSA